MRVFQGRLPFSRPFVGFWPRLPSCGFFAPYISFAVLECNGARETNSQCPAYGGQLTRPAADGRESTRHHTDTHYVLDSCSDMGRHTTNSNKVTKVMGNMLTNSNKETIIEMCNLAITIDIDKQLTRIKQIGVNDTITTRGPSRRRGTQREGDSMETVQSNYIILQQEGKKVKRVDDDIYVSDQGCGIYNDATGLRVEIFREAR